MVVHPLRELERIGEDAFVGKRRDDDPHGEPNRKQGEDAIGPADRVLADVHPITTSSDVERRCRGRERVAVRPRPMRANSLVENEVRLGQRDLVLGRRRAHCDALVVATVVLTRPRVTVPRVGLNRTGPLREFRRGDLGKHLTAYPLRNSELVVVDFFGRDRRRRLRRQQG